MLQVKMLRKISKLPIISEAPSKSSYDIHPIFMKALQNLAHEAEVVLASRTVIQLIFNSNLVSFCKDWESKLVTITGERNVL